jgi:hypothetical protein
VRARAARGNTATPPGATTRGRCNQQQQQQQQLTPSAPPASCRRCRHCCTLRAADGCRYAARFPTRPNGRYCTIRLPWALFRAEYPGGDSQPPLDPAAVTNISIRYAVRSSAQAPAVQQQQQQQQAAPAAPAPAQPPPGAAPPSLFVPQGARLPAAAAADPSLRARQAALARQKQQEAEQRFARFSLEVDWIKALPSGIEPEFVLVSCAGSANRPDLEPADLSRILGAKRRGEEGLRASGLGYTIIRPGPLVVRAAARCWVVCVCVCACVCTHTHTHMCVCACVRAAGGSVGWPVQMHAMHVSCVPPPCTPPLRRQLARPTTHAAPHAPHHTPCTTGRARRLQGARV